MNNNIYISTTFLPDQEKLKSAISILNKNQLYNIEIGSNHRYEKNYNYIEVSNEDEADCIRAIISAENIKKFIKKF